MPRKQGVSPSTSKSSDRGGVSYADVRYTESDQTAFSEWLETHGVSPIDALSTLTADLYRVTVKIDVNNNCSQVSVTQQDERKHKNSNIVLVVRASTDEKAILLAAWTIFEMFHNGPLPVEKQSNEVWF